MGRKILVADLLCGAGGSSTGCARAMRDLGLEMELVCVNHWPVAIETHRRNHPEARHYCQDIATVRPHLIVPEGYLDLLMASPTCTHHSVARGGKPTSDQQRSDPWHIITWFTELRVKRAIIENVWEYTSWGPVDPRTGKPIKSRKGEYHRAWIDTIWKLGATSVEWRKLNSANYGGAQTRVRYIAKIRFDKVSLGWAPLTHIKRQEGKLELFPTLKQWRPAREIIDWSIRGVSIFNRPRPLAPKTLARILAGATKFDWPRPYRIRIAGELERSLKHYIGVAFGLRNARKAAVRKRARQQLRAYVDWLRTMGVVADDRPGARAKAGPVLITLRRNVSGRSMEEPIPALAAGGAHIGLAEPFILNRHGENGGVRAHSPDDPAPASDCRGGGYLVEPFVMSRHAGGAPRSTTEPTPTQVAKQSHVLISPYYGSGSGETCISGADPLPTVTSKARFGMIVPVTHSDGSNRARDIDADPVPTVTCANRGEYAFITAQFGERDGQAPRVHDIDEPAPTLCASGHVNLVEGLENYDVLFRMFAVHELAAAMGFNHEEARYEFTGTKTEQIKQIGNAVHVDMMEAEVKAFMTDAVRRPKAEFAVETMRRRA